MPEALVVKRRRVGVRLLVLTVAVLFALGCIEGILQVLDPGNFAELEERERFSAEILARGDDGVLRLVPGAASRYLGHAVAISAQRLRNPLLAVPRPTGIYRILVVGDSVAFGWGVEEEDAFPRRLERALQGQHRQDGRSYEVVNGGSPGWGLPEEYFWLRDRGMAFEPDLVLHCIINNDVDPLPKPPPLFLTPMLRHLRFLRLHERGAGALVGDRGTEPGSGLSPEQIVFALDNFQQLCAGKQVRYVVMDTVGLPQLAIDRCAQIGANYIDCRVSEQWIHDHQVTPTDFHPGAAGHEELTRRMLPALQALLQR
jgi:lysophospholipase L1-like esterase